MVTAKSRTSWIAAAALASVLGVVGWVFADCTTYYNSRVEYHGGGAICAGSGSGCTECTDSEGGSCVTNGSSCTPDVRN